MGRKIRTTIAATGPNPNRAKDPTRSRQQQTKGKPEPKKSIECLLRTPSPATTPNNNHKRSSPPFRIRSTSRARHPEHGLKRIHGEEIVEGQVNRATEHRETKQKTARIFRRRLTPLANFRHARKIFALRFLASAASAGEKRESGEAEFEPAREVGGGKSAQFLLRSRALCAGLP